MCFYLNNRKFIEIKSYMADFYPEYPGTLVCPYCRYRGPTIVRLEKKYLLLNNFQIITLSKSKPFISCAVCSSILGRKHLILCSFCKSPLPPTFAYCAICGDDILKIGNWFRL